MIPPPVQFALTSRRGPARSAHAVAASMDGDRGRELGGLGARGRGLFARRGGTVRAPAHDAPSGRPAGAAVVSGAHAWSRNPMYLSLTVIYAGSALALGRAWPLALVVVALGFVLG